MTTGWLLGNILGKNQPNSQIGFEHFLLSSWLTIFISYVHFDFFLVTYLTPAVHCGRRNFDFRFCHIFCHIKGRILTWPL